MIPAPGLGYVIQEMWAWLSIHEDGDEGVIGYYNPDMGGWMPLVGADRERIESFRAYANQAATLSGKPVVLARFSVRTDVEQFDP